MQKSIPIVFLGLFSDSNLKVRKQKKLLTIQDRALGFIPIQFPVLLLFSYQFTRGSYRVAYGVRGFEISALVYLSFISKKTYSN